MSVKSRMPGLLKVQHPHTGPRGFELADASGLNQVCQDITEGNAHRLAACWNACEGISTENLEDNLPVQELATRYNAVLAQRDELLKALKEVSEVFDVSWRNGSTQRRLGDLARAAIAKATGETK